MPQEIANVVLKAQSINCNNSDLCRSPAEVIISCSAILFLCAWATAHPSVPRYPHSSSWMTLVRDNRNDGLISAIWFFFEENRTALAILGLVAPEYLVFRAVQVWLQSCAALRRIKSKLLAPSASVGCSQFKPSLALYPACSWTETHVQFLYMRGFQLSGMSNRLVDLNWSHDDLPQILSVTTKDIRDKSKADSGAKLMATIQLLWFILQGVSRKVGGFTITNLELTTLANVVLTTVLYFFCWNRPLDIRTPLVIHAENRMAILEPLGLVETSPPTEPKLPTRVWLGARLAGPSEEAPRSIFAIFMTVLVSASFLGIHGATWDKGFPSETECRIWNFSMVFSGLSIVIALSMSHALAKGTLKNSIGGIILVLLTALVYLVARTSFFILALSTLRTLPSDPRAYLIPAWIRYFPHV